MHAPAAARTAAVDHGAEDGTPSGLVYAQNELFSSVVHVWA